MAWSLTGKNWYLNQRNTAHKMNDATILTVQEIIANKENIYSCAKAFREDANTLMVQLSQKFNFNLNDCGAWPTAVYKTDFYKKGMLNAEWTFFLHGSHCRFDNLQTGQAVEVYYTEKPEFGRLDGFFFYNYMQTTNTFNNLARWFNNHVNVNKALEILSSEGTLTKKRKSIGSGNYVVAL